MSSKVVLQIVGMHCTSCALTIDMDLEDLPGVKKANTSYAKSITEVEFDAELVNLDAIVHTIAKTGYTAKPS